MELHDVETLARALMAEHGISAAGWTFGFDRATRRMGLCQFDIKHISLSRLYAEKADEAHVTDTILHEIAHALTPGAGHGLRWKVIARKLGATPRACADNPFVDSAEEVAKRLAAVDGKPFYRVVGDKRGDRRYRILRDSHQSYMLLDEEGVEMRASKCLVYPEGDNPPTHREMRDGERRRNLDAVAGKPVYTLGHRAYEGRSYAILRPATKRARPVIVDLATGDAMRCSLRLIPAGGRYEQRLLHAG